MTPEQERLQSILMPEAHARMKALRNAPEVRFVHYTPADTALKIIRDRGIWMRSAFLMNDFSEVRHGNECFFHAWNGAPGTALRDAMSKLHPDLPGMFDDKFFENFSRNLQTETYLTSFCEHSGEETDTYGRLSMWRAYGGDNGVAFVVKKSAFINEREAGHLFSSPVAYWGKERVAEEMVKIAHLVGNNLDAFATFELEILFNTFVLVFVAAVLCVKHPAFQEESEWRIFHNTLWPMSPLLERKVETVRGVPQIIFRLKLHGPKDEDQSGVGLAEVFDRMLIGPSAFPYPIYQGLAQTLTEAGIPEAAERVFVTGIPLRR